ncbi:hypothetical protein [uncultured Tateyamaria sp.]|uniref:hypothetical protein n=1 Tax=uncultured Tateyamaria sp. TaxID=455651 RepID=UPI002606733E|nr:hypothetical protein [uncultured Tateyamaria sp.]
MQLGKVPSSGWAAIAVTILLVLSFVPALSSLSNLHPFAYVEAQNTATLETAIKSNAEDLVAFTEALTVLNVTASTDVGVALIVKADIQIGNAVSEAQALLQRAQYVAIGAAAVLEGLRVLSDVAASLGPYIYKAVLVIILAALGAAWLFHQGAAHVIALDVLRIVLMVFVAVTVIFPLSLYLAGGVVSLVDMHALLAPKAAAHDLANAARDTFKGKDVVAHWGEGDNIKAGLNTLHETFMSKVGDLFEYVTGLVVFHTMHGLVLPLLVFAVNWTVARAIIAHLFVPTIAAMTDERKASAGKTPKTHA